jgi:hypothetical protein
MKFIKKILGITKLEADNDVLWRRIIRLENRVNKRAQRHDQEQRAAKRRRKG